MKRKIYLFLFMLTVLVNAVWAKDTIRVDGITYTIRSLYKLTVEKGEYSGDIVLPTSVLYNHNSYAVYEIGEEAFKDCTGLTSITIPYSVLWINRYAFQGCTGLTSVNFTNNNFRSSITILEGAFYGCTNLTSISLPDNCIALDRFLFYGCTNLSSFIIPNSVESIGERAFYGCSSLTTITIPASVVYLYGGHPFKNTGLTEIHVAEGNTSFCSVDGVLFNRDTTTLIKYPEKKAGNVYVIPNTVTNVGDFSRSENLTSIIVPNTVTQFFETFGFENCPNLTSVHFPDIEAWCDITFVTSYANPLYSGKNLYINNELVQNVTIPDGTTEVKRYIFWGCTSLNSVTIPSTVTLLREGAFGYCTNLTSFYSYAATPPAAYCFNEVDKSKCNLYVPATSYLLYKNANEWKDFAQILPISGEWRWVKFLDWDDSLLWEGYVEYGTAATAPTTPSRENYTFIGWDKDFSNITEETVIKAQYTINRYLVQFFDWDDTLLKEDSVAHGTAAVAPNDPIREGYTFVGWDTEYDSIIHDTYIYPLYEINYYNVQFVDWDNTVLSEQQVAYGYAATPPYAEFSREGYKFIGWDKDFERVTEDMIITAQYQILKFYVRFLDWDYRVLQSTEVDYGTIPEYTSELPEKADDERYTYTFKGWFPILSPVYSDMDYIATYEEKLHEFTVTFLDWDGTIIKTQQVEYGSYATAPEETPLREGYTFIGWDKEFSYIISDLTINALYEKDIKYYTITFVNWDGLVLMNIVGVEENTLPVYTAELPTRPENDKFTYTFVGWTPEIVPATEDATYTATYTATPKTEGNEDVSIDQSSATKILRNGQIFILRGDKIYTLTGQEVK